MERLWHSSVLLRRRWSGSSRAYCIYSIKWITLQRSYSTGKIGKILINLPEFKQNVIVLQQIVSILVFQTPIQMWCISEWFCNLICPCKSSPPSVNNNCRQCMWSFGLQKALLRIGVMQIWGGNDKRWQNDQYSKLKQLNFCQSGKLVAQSCGTVSDHRSAFRIQNAKKSW